MSRRNFLCFLTVLLILAACVPLAQAKVKLPSIISDNMVLQQDRPVTIWGWAEPGEKITIETGVTNHLLSADLDIPMYPERVTATTDKQGRWETALRPRESGQMLKMTITDSADEETTVKNILVGEVWLCSGQSNMELSVARSNDAKKEIAAGEYPKIRFFQVRNRTADKPQQDCQGRWVLCSPETVGRHTAVGYFFGRDLFIRFGSDVSCHAKRTATGERTASLPTTIASPSIVVSAG